MVAQLVYLTLQPLFLNRHTREGLQLLCGAPVCHVFTFCLTDVTRHMMIVPMPLPFHACTLEAVTTSVIHHNDQPLDYTGWSWFHVPYIGKYLCYSLDVINSRAKKLK